jgi:hypothetical protein
MAAQIPKVFVQEPQSESSQPQGRITGSEPSPSQQNRLRATLFISSKLHLLQPTPIIFFDDADRNLYKRISDRIATECRDRKLVCSYDMTIAYQSDQPLSESCHSQKSFRQILDKIKASNCTNFEVRALVDGARSVDAVATAWQRALDVLTRGRIDKGNKKYTICKESWDNFRRDTSLLKDICNEDPRMGETFGRDLGALEALQSDGIKLLAIFILMHTSDSQTIFCDFWRNGCRDESLPFDRSDKFTYCAKELIWSSLCDTQWQIMPIELKPLDKGIAPLHFDSEQVLPFEVGRTLGKGGFGTVFEITLDDDHPEIYEVLCACDQGKVCFLVFDLLTLLDIELTIP